jgi:nicotinamidase-related amidase
MNDVNAARIGLLVIDVQRGFDDPYWGTRNNRDAEARITELLTAWRQAGAVIVHVQHMSTTAVSPLRPGQPGNDFKPEAMPLPAEPIVQKTVNSAFIGTTLEQQLRAAGVDTLVIAGITTDHCVSTTTRMAANLGFTTFLVSDATATFDRTGPDGVHYTAEQMHSHALASLHGEFATVVTAREAIATLGRRS